MGTLRLTGGEFRGRFIHCPASLNTRPTQARLRQALFNSVQSILGGARVLDLFAGSGALGFEALSRGAAEVTFVEADRSAVKLLQRNAADLKVETRVRILGEPLERAWPRLKAAAPFDLVLADPPYAEDWERRLLLETPWAEILVEGGLFCLEWGRLKSVEFREGVLPERVPFLVKSREKPYGDSVLSTFQREQT